MAIVVFRDNPTPIALESMACTLSTRQIKIPRNDDQSVKFVFCECDYIERVFHSESGLEREQDRRSFLVELQDNSSFASFTLVKGNTEIPLVDETYGEFFAVGSFSLHPLKTGFIIDWKKVFDAFGNGYYTVRIDQTNFGVVNSVESHIYWLLPFTPLNAKGTVKIETIHNNTIDAGEDYEGMNWYKALRVRGRLGGRTIEHEEENYQRSDRKLEQIITQIKTGYTLEINLSPSYILDQLIFDQNLATTIQLTNYGIYEFKDYNKLGVRVDEISKSEDFERNNLGLYEIKFIDADEGFISKNN